MSVSAADKAVAARVLRESGHDTDVIADLLHASVRTVQRWLQQVPEVDGPARTMLAGIEALIAGQDLDDQSRMWADMALALADKMDKVRVSDKAQTGNELAQLSKELRAVVADIMGTSQDDREWLAGLLTPVRNSENPGT